MRFAVQMLAFVLTAVLSSCGSGQHDGTGGGRDTVKPVWPVRGRLPAGRYQLPTRHTPAPDFWITLPEGYTVKNAGTMPGDELYLFRNDDPSLKDSTAVTNGVLRFYIGDRSQAAFHQDGSSDNHNVVIAGRPLVWRYWTEKISGSRQFYNREILSHDFFAAISPELARAGLHLHIFVGGVDSAQVETLCRAVETISMHP